MKKWTAFLKPYAISVVCGMILALAFPVTEPVEASPIKNWTANEYITYTDLNKVLNHLHASVGHGHGPIITAADISSSAGIRPEQTTFGSSINKTLVAEGTWSKNPDGGTTFIPINYNGSLDITITNSSTGFIITGAAATGALTDGGSYMYTVLYKPVNDAGTVATVTACNDINSTLKSPLLVTGYCYYISAVGTGLTPNGLSVEVYSNKVQ